MSENLLQAEIREVAGKESAKKLRKQGKIPGIFYTHGEAPVPIVLDEQDSMKLLTSETGLFDFQIGKKRKRKAIIKEVQTDPLSQKLLHIDVLGVRLEERITVAVPVQIVGEAVGVKQQGGILHQYLRELQVECLPLDIPERITVDVTNLNIGDTITARALVVEKVQILNDPEQPIVNVLPPTIVKEAKVEAAEAAAEAEAAAAAEAEKKTDDKSERSN